MDRLKPCPFCGESKYITFKKDSIPDGQCHYYDWVIRCEKCHIKISIAADNYYEETEDYIAIYNQVLMPDGTCKYCKIIYYNKFPKYDERNGKQILFEIIIPDDEEIKE